jgi:hypothetical protein
VSTTNFDNVTTTPRRADERAIGSRPTHRTTEFMVYVACVLAVALTALFVGDRGKGTADPFSAEQALRYITFLTIGYMIARGLAKSGARHHNNDHDA